MSIKIEDPVQISLEVYPLGADVWLDRGKGQERIPARVVTAHIRSAHPATELVTASYTVVYWNGSRTETEVEAWEIFPKDHRSSMEIGFHSQEIPEAKDCPSCGRLMERICPSCSEEEEPKGFISILSAKVATRIYMYLKEKDLDIDPALWRLIIREEWGRLDDPSYVAEEPS